jgi:hypothetical protein
MKTHTHEWLPSTTSNRTFTVPSATSLNRALGLAAKAFTAFVPALAIVVGAAWAITIPALEQILEASLWASGFIFLALAVDSERPSVGPLLITGLALPILALLSSRVAAEFTIVAAVLLAAWVAASILRR